MTSDPQRDLNRAALALTNAAQHWLDARRVMRDQRDDGTKGRSFDTTGRGATTIRDDQGHDLEATTIEAAVLDPRRDDARHAITESEHLIHQLVRHSVRLEELVDQYKPTRGADTTTEAQINDGPGPDGCKSCWRHVRRDGTRYWQPIDLDNQGTPRYAGLCRWCGEHLKAYKTLPSTDLLEYHHAGKRISLDAKEADAKKMLKAKLDAKKRAKRKGKKK